MTGRSLMRAVRVANFGGPEVMRVECNVPVPQPSDNQILVELKAAGINPVDTYIRAGAYAIKPQLPFTPGSDGAGVVKQIGAGVTKVKPGDKVFVIKNQTGSYAEYLTTEENFVGLLGDKLTFQQGAGVGIPCYSAYRALCLKAKSRVHPGNTVLIHGASGAVGLACIQIAVSRGMKVLGTAGSPEGLELIQKQGASAVYNHKEEGYTNKIMEETEGEGPDVIIEMLANVNLETDLNLIKKNGIIVVVITMTDMETEMKFPENELLKIFSWMTKKIDAYMKLPFINLYQMVVGNRGSVEINPRATMQKECMVTGMLLMNASKDEWAEMHAAIAEGIKNGWLVPHINKEYSLDEATQAHEDIINGGPALGKRIFVI